MKLKFAGFVFVTEAFIHKTGAFGFENEGSGFKICLPIICAVSGSYGNLHCLLYLSEHDSFLSGKSVVFGNHVFNDFSGSLFFAQC